MQGRDVHVGQLVKRLSEAFDRVANNQMRSVGVSASQMRVLVTLDQAGGTLPIKELQASAGVAQSTMWGIVRRLEDKGLVRTARTAAESRARQVSLTAAGASVCLDGHRFMEGVEATLLGCLTEDEVEELRCLLMRVCAAADERAETL